MLLTEMTKEELEILVREQNADLLVMAETKRKVLEKNKGLVALYKQVQQTIRVQREENYNLREQNVALCQENAELIMLCKKHGLL